MSDDCPFCRPAAERLFYVGRHVLGLWDAFPVSPGHALLVPKRHVASWFDTSEEERAELLSAIGQARAAIEQEHRPDGFNLGVNIGATAGQTVPHVHLHVIPRFRDDVADPRGGVRGVIPAKQNYLTGSDLGAALLHDREEAASALRTAALVTGGEDPLLPHLKGHLDAAQHVHIAVAFVLPSGIDLLDEHLRDLCQRQGRLEFLTGDYQDFTDPDALARLLDFQEQYPEQIELRVYICDGGSFHPKTYIFEGTAEGGVAFVGSSNLTRTALAEGIEWNYRVVPSRDAAGFREVMTSFGALFRSAPTVPLDRSWLDSYRSRRAVAEGIRRREPADVVAEPPEPPPEPHAVQQEALAALEDTRAKGAQAGLVVLATGLGKTWLAAFDSHRPQFRRVLFVAHREEILGQAMKTVRRIRPAARLGLYTGTEKDREADVVFASVQTLNREAHLSRFDRRDFDYIVVDEFHHAAANTYRRLIDYFEPHFLLGLTATPERTDGGDLLSLCGENLVYRCDVREAIARGLLSTFRYFGVPDDVNYENIPWRSQRFDEEKLTEAVATRDRAQNALEQVQKHGGRRVLAFCCSKRHADFMKGYFLDAGVKAAAVHSGAGSDPRAASLERLEAGDLQVVFAVDMFNEGVDIPHVDTVLMLRPTESRLLWSQQFGRGLRKAEGKRDLAVIDYIGNHRSFLTKVEALFDLLPGDQYIRSQLERLQAGEAELPPGCEVTYELRVFDILRSLLRPVRGQEVVQSYYETFREQQGRRPTASEALHDGYPPRVAARGYGSWLRFVEAMGDLRDASELLDTATPSGSLLEQLESTPMVKSYKMLVLLSMLQEGRFPGEIGIETLTQLVERLARRSPALVADFAGAIESREVLQRSLEQNPIEAWTGGSGTGGRSYFAYENGTFGTTFEVPADRVERFRELVREIAEYRLAEYLGRSLGHSTDGSRFRCRLSHADGRPILFLPDRARVPGIPEGWVPVIADGQAYEANFVKVAVNVLRRVGSQENVLPALLRQWFGDQAGSPGTRAEVEFSDQTGDWVFAPVSAPLDRWRSYARREVAERFGQPYSRYWEQGVVTRGDHTFLFVTLDKSDLPEGHRYGDRFLDRHLFEWQSQNRTGRDMPAGKNFRDHAEKGFTVHLFIRKQAKLEGRGAPFVYCGPVEFVDWEGDQPITIRWRLGEPIPDSLWAAFTTGGDGRT
jgi:superfamily II DNA or RNA helicase/diadenosine tetraphosphate (Ap4A) HIT family hydrolase